MLNVVRRLVDSKRRGDETPFFPDPRTWTPDPKKHQSLLTSAPTGEFTTTDAFAFTSELEQLHPGNRHVKYKIRQQLQVLRDAGLLLHIGRNCWRLP